MKLSLIRKPPYSFVIAILIIALAVVLRVHFLGSLLETQLIFATFYPAVVASAFWGGLWSGLLATTLSAVAATYFLFPPQYSFSVSPAIFGVDMAVFLPSGVAISFIAEGMYRARTRLLLYQQHLAELVEKRTLELKSSEQLWAVTLGSIGDGVIVTDEAGRIRYMNAAAETLTGWSRQEALQKLLADVFIIIDEQLRKPVEDPVARMFTEAAVVGLVDHIILLRKDGAELFIGISAAPVREEDGHIKGAVLVFRDISERKKREEMIRIFVKHIPSAVAMFDQEMCYIAYSDRWLLEYGLEDQSLVGRSHYDIFPEISEEWKSIHVRCLQGAWMKREEDRFPRKDGTIQWLRWEIYPWKFIQRADRGNHHIRRGHYKTQMHGVCPAG